MNEPAPVFDREPPRSDEAEVSVIGGMMLDDEAADLGLELVGKGDLYYQPHRLIYEAVSRLRAKGHSADPFSVKGELGVMGKYDKVGDEYLAQIVEVVPTSANLEYHAQHVIDTATKRRLISAMARVTKEAYAPGSKIHELVDLAEREVLSATQRHAGNGDGLVQVSQLLRNTMNLIMSGSQNGIPTGFADLDDKIGGLMPGELAILAARPSMGKSALGFQIAANVAFGQGVPIAIFSLEMSREQSVMRFLAAEAKVNLDNLVRARPDLIGTEGLERLDDASRRFMDAPVFIDDEGCVNIMALRSRARRLKSKHGIGLVVVDYLQLMEGSGDGRTEVVGSISRGLKRLAGELGVPVLALAQLNRAVESRENKRPRLYDLRDSGEIEQDADLVMFLYRDSYYKGPENTDESLAELIIAKQRNGPLGRVNLKFDPKYTRFDNYGLTEEYGW